MTEGLFTTNAVCCVAEPLQCTASGMKLCESTLRHRLSRSHLIHLYESFHTSYKTINRDHFIPSIQPTTTTTTTLTAIFVGQPG